MFIRGPYIVEGIIYGTISAVLSMVILFPVVYFISPDVKKLIPDMDLLSYFTSNFFQFFAYQLLFGIGIGIVSSFIAIRRYLRI